MKREILALSQELGSKMYFIKSGIEILGNRRSFAVVVGMKKTNDLAELTTSNAFLKKIHPNLHLNFHLTSKIHDIFINLKDTLCLTANDKFV